MVAPSPEVNAYLELADSLIYGRLTEADLASSTIHLPPLTNELLQTLANLAQKVALTQPKHAWAITAVAASQPTNNVFLSGLADWYLARAANAWAQPQIVEAAITRARNKFAASEEKGWLAACDWQLNALPWTRSDFVVAATALDKATTGLEAAGFDKFVPDCRLSLAYANLLIGRFDLASELTSESKKTYQAHDQQLGQGRCLLTQASIFRRQSDFAAAKACLEEALPLLQDAPLYTAQAYFQLAHVALASQDHFSSAEKWFLHALELFDAGELRLWTAQCHAALAQLYNQMGRLKEAGAALQLAREIYSDFDIKGLQADILLDSGRFELLKGNYEVSLNYFGEAEALYGRTGNEWMPIVCLLNQGQAYFHLGFYQRSLHFLERAYRRLQTLNIAYRTAASEKHLAHCWLKLGQFDQAHTYLDKADAHYKQARQNKYLYEVYLLRAETLLQGGQTTEAIVFLEKALTIAQAEGAKIETAFCQRLLGETLCRLGEFKQAFQYLATAESNFAQMNMNAELASCQVTWGTYRQQAGELEAARAAWEKALDLNQDALQEIVWQAHAGLASTAFAENQVESALDHYRAMMKALNRLRQGLWQPALAGSFLRQPLPMLDKAITLAVQQEAHQDTLNFIEESKAQTIAWRLRSARSQRDTLPENTALAEIATEIRWLQEKLTVIFESRPDALHLGSQISLRKQLVQKIAAYDELKSQVEREQLTRQPETILSTTFDLGDFRELASQRLGQNWLALDYYLAEEQLFVVLLGPDECQTWSTPISGQARLALQLITRSRGTGEVVPERPLKQLGAWLFPESVQVRLTPETYLILSPHSQLHHIPWPALHLHEAPIVSGCIPVIVPSLFNLALLWSRSSELASTKNSGLLLTISDFRGRYPPLPAVVREAALMAPIVGEAGVELVESAATWDNLAALTNGEEGLARFPFWHIATHAFHDGLSGRLSGVALYDRDIWLDELSQLAPLPPLVMLSACSGGSSLVFTGDEHVSLTMTCLMAGAQTVVGTIWPLLDEQAPDLIHRFYRHWQSGLSVSRSLAMAQREALESGQDVVHWGAFLCIGEP
jgi:tetratricopeptide (TPR) repeat protein